MSWIRSAVYKAVEVGGNNNLTRTVRSYADSVVQQAGQAVAGGTKIIQDRIAARNFKSFKLAVKRLEEVSVSCRGIERVQLLRRWLVALKEIERISGGDIEINGTNPEQVHISDESKDSPRKPTVVLYYDADLGGEAMNFREVFLHSQALEGMTLSMILEAPNDEEVALLLEIFGLCLTGGKEIHTATVSSILNLAKAFSSYEDEVLAKREELLQYAQGAIAGLKQNADIARIDFEVSNIHQNLDGMRPQQLSSDGDIKSSAATTLATAEDLKEACAQIQLCSRLEALLLKKKYLNNGDAPEIHAQKVDKLKILSESLVSSASKAEMRISDHRFLVIILSCISREVLGVTSHAYYILNRCQKEEALNFRVTKTSEVSQLEKELAAEVEALEKQRDKLEAELKKVNTSLASAHARLHIAREERDQFDEASNQLLVHLKIKEDELSRSIASYRAEADVCNSFINFLEGTWVFHSSYTDQKEKQVNDELERYEDYFVSLAVRLLSAYKDELGPSITSIRKLVENLKESDIAVDVSNENTEEVNKRKNLGEEYLNLEAKFIAMFSVVESIKRQFYTQSEEISRKGDHRVKEMFVALGKIKDEFESIERPTLEAEVRSQKADTPSKERPQRSLSPSFKQASKDQFESNEGQKFEFETQMKKSDTSTKESPQKSLSPTVKQTTETLEYKQDEFSELPVIKSEKLSNPEAALSKLKLELEFENNRNLSKEEIGEWEFDELEKELKNDESASHK